MKCSNCGAVIKDGSKFCEFCGDSITANMKRDQEYVNKAGCPKCGSSNIKFEREKQGEVRGKKGTAVVRATVGFCGDCGYTWHTAGSSNQPKKNNMIWWVLGWIFFFPAPVMVLIWRKKCKWDIKIKIGVTVAFWIVFFIIGASGGESSSSSSSSQTTTAPAVVIEKKDDESAVEEKTPEIIPEVESEKDVFEEVREAVEELPDPTSDMTMGQKQAIKSAERYLDLTAFSKAGLIEQLSSEYGDGFEVEDATFAVEYLEENNMVDWNEQAVKAAQKYLDLTSFSKEGLIEQLSSEYGDKYTKEQAQYAVSAVGF